MITEDYVSFETAKLLKEKGFDEICFAVWRYWEDSIGKPCFINSLSMVDEKGYPYCYNSRIEKSINDGEIDIACPTLQMAMKWLREEKGIAVIPALSSIFDCEKFLWDVNVIVAKTGDTYCQGWVYGKQEEACEYAIKYCLENLI